MCAPAAVALETADAGDCIENDRSGGPDGIWNELAWLPEIPHGNIATVGEFFTPGPNLFAGPFFGAMAAVTIGLRFCMNVSLRSSCEPLAVCLSLCRAQRSCRTNDRLHSGKSQW